MTVCCIILVQILMSATEGWVNVNWMRLASTHLGVMTVCATLGSLAMDSYAWVRNHRSYEDSCHQDIWMKPYLLTPRTKGKLDLTSATAFTWAQNWAALCSEVSGALTTRMACMLCVMYDSSLFRGLVSSCLPTATVLAWNAHYSDILTPLCNWVTGKAFNISTGSTHSVIRLIHNKRSCPPNTWLLLLAAITPRCIP